MVLFYGHVSLPEFNNKAAVSDLWFFPRLPFPLGRDDQLTISASHLRPTGQSWVRSLGSNLHIDLYHPWSDIWNSSETETSFHCSHEKISGGVSTQQPNITQRLGQKYVYLKSFHHSRCIAQLHSAFCGWYHWSSSGWSFRLKSVELTPKNATSYILVKDQYGDIGQHEIVCWKGCRLQLGNNI